MPNISSFFTGNIRFFVLYCFPVRLAGNREDETNDMDKIKRNERLAVMTQILTASPNRIFTLSHFCELFSTAKSTISEDVAILQQTMQQFRLGKLETVTGAAGGVRYRPIGLGSNSRGFVEGICERLREPARHLPGGYLYFSDILSEPQLVQGMGTLIASQYYDAGVDFVLTMETKGIPVALMTAGALRVPLIIARHATKVYEGSAVNISYVSGSGNIETMALSRRAVKEGQRALIVDDFMRGGGTARGMIELMKEFSVTVAGICFVLALENPKHRSIQGEKSLMLLGDIRDGEQLNIRPAEWIE